MIAHPGDRFSHVVVHIKPEHERKWFSCMKYINTYIVDQSVYLGSPPAPSVGYPIHKTF